MWHGVIRYFFPCCELLWAGSIYHIWSGWTSFQVVVVLRSPIHANEPSEYNGMLYRTSNRVLNNGIKVIILICMDGTSQYHHHQFWYLVFKSPFITVYYNELALLGVVSEWWWTLALTRSWCWSVALARVHLDGLEASVKCPKVGCHQGNVKGESVVAAILPSRMGVSYCTSGSFCS